MQLPHPKIGQWYRLDSGELFEVVAIDEHDRTIEIQHSDGTIDEYDFNSWSISEITEANPPKDWSGAYDMLTEDYGVDRENYTEIFRGNELDQFK